MKFILPALASFLVSLSCLASPASDREVLAPFLPENNSSCKFLTPIPFTTVILEPGMQCSAASGVTDIVKRVNSWLPRNAMRPRLGLLMKATDSNAFYSYYALNVPLRIEGDRSRGYKRFFPSDLSRAVVAHEYGHAILQTTMASFNGELRDLLRLLYGYGEQMAITTVIRARATADLERLAAEFNAKYGTQDQWTPEQMAAYGRAVDELNAKIDPAADVNQRLITEFEGQASKRLEKILTVLGSYHEFFGDLVAVLDAKDWTISGRLIAALAGDKASGVPRDFTDASNSYENSLNMEAHDLLGPARYDLYRYLKNQRCLNPNPKVLLGVVLDAIQEHSRTELGSAEPQTASARMAFNKAFTRAINWRLDRALRDLCGRR